MGAGASVDHMQAAANKAANMPLDAGDITDLDQAKVEIARLRQICHFYRYECVVK